MSLIKIKCAFCNKIFLRPPGRINEAKKFSWKQYCSKKCRNQSKITGIQRKCANPICKRAVSRELSQFKKSKSARIFCSSSCAAIVNNSARRKFKKCPICGKKFYGERKYCLKLCRFGAVNPNKKSESEKRKIILNKIRSFRKIQGRIPTKKEKPGLAMGAQAIFGTWNRAIEAAGFEPNPVMFAKKYTADDGHQCDSFAEKVIDDWLYAKKIEHRRSVPYPSKSVLTADFLIGKLWVEFFGLAGVLKHYDQLIKEKRAIAEKHGLQLIEIYPRDLFPVNHLSQIIKI